VKYFTRFFWIQERMTSRQDNLPNVSFNDLRNRIQALQSEKEMRACVRSFLNANMQGSSKVSRSLDASERFSLGKIG
jgi:hypothetical protein